MPIARLDHAGFTVSDLDRSVAWYSEFLGAPPSLRDTWDVDYVSRLLGYPKVTIECAFWRLPGGGLLELIGFHEPPAEVVDMETYNIGNGHLCFEVDDLHGEYERLRDIAAFRSPEPIDIPWGPYKGGRVCYLRDPDGITVQLVQPPPGGPAIPSAEAGA